MKPIDFPGREAILGAPADWDEAQHGPCEGLPIIRQDGACVSLWEATPEERDAIAAGANIWLHVWSGMTQPPVGLAVTEMPDPAVLGEVFPILLTGDGTPDGTRIVDMRNRRHLRTVKRLTLVLDDQRNNTLAMAHLVLHAGDHGRYGDVDSSVDALDGLRCQAVIVAVEEW